jgi:hypothetical protein
MNRVMKCLLASVLLGVLFFALSPGVLLTLPPVKGCKSQKGVLLQLWRKDVDETCGAGGCATSWEAALVHAVVFSLVAFAVLYVVGCRRVPPMTL